MRLSALGFGYARQREVERLFTWTHADDIYQRLQALEKSIPNQQTFQQLWEQIKPRLKDYQRSVDKYLPPFAQFISWKSLASHVIEDIDKSLEPPQKSQSRFDVLQQDVSTLNQYNQKLVHDRVQDCIKSFRALQNAQQKWFDQDNIREINAAIQLVDQCILLGNRILPDPNQWNGYPQKVHDVLKKPLAIAGNIIFMQQLIHQTDKGFLQMGRELRKAQYIEAILSPHLQKARDRHAKLVGKTGEAEEIHQVQHILETLKTNLANSLKNSI